MISFEMTNEQLMFQEQFRNVAKEKLQPYSLEIDKNPPSPIDKFFLKTIADQGLNKFIIPKEYGGTPLDWVTLSIITEELAYGCAGLATCYAATLHAVSTILIGGTEEQKKTFLPLLLSSDGEVASCLITEEKGGSDTTHCTTIATCEEDCYVINGKKIAILNAGNAAFYVVWANIEHTRGRAGINAFIIPANTKGLTFGPYDDKLGLRNAPTSTIYLKDVVVPKENLIGFVGSGYLLLAQTLDLGRAFFGSICTGLARAAIEEATIFSKNRIVLKRRIINNQGISLPLAELSTKLEAARLLVWKACRLMDLKKDYSVESSMAKLFASELAILASSEGLQFLGKKGYMRPSLMEKLQRDALILRIVEGTNIVQRIIIASQL